LGAIHQSGKELAQPAKERKGPACPREKDYVVNVSVVECADMRSDDCCHSQSVYIPHTARDRSDETGVP
jgi:hypothetical protein